MPTYSYACKDCDNAFDVQQAFTDDALTVCPSCGGTLRKRYGSVGVVFKGSGFYRTDSRKGSVPSTPKSDSGGSSESSSSSSSSGSSESSASGSSNSGSSGSGSSTGGSSTKAASTSSSKAAASA